ncbi:MAG: hypothetical protein J1G30_09670 [Spirochaetales bacterium]|nr:hypothetical protein [Spirochaetales bacterium]
MKRIISILTLVAAMFTFVACGGEGSSTAQTQTTAPAESATVSDTLKGFKIEGDKVIFTFNVKDYASFEEIEEVTVAGDFNGWDPVAADWQATDDDGDGIWTFETDLATVPYGTKFKFVTNQVDWMQPNADVLDAKYLADDGFGGFNLVLAE